MFALKYSHCSIMIVLLSLQILVAKSSSLPLSPLSKVLPKTSSSSIRTTFNIAGSVGDTDQAWSFPLTGVSLHVVPNAKDPSLLPTIFVIDTSLCVVRQIIGNQSRVVAGTGECGSNGADLVPGTDCLLKDPTALFHDASTNYLYILERSILKVLDMSSGIIWVIKMTFISPWNFKEFSLAVAMTKFNSDFYVTDFVGLIWKVTIQNGNVGKATLHVGQLYRENFNCNNVFATQCNMNSPLSTSFFPDGTMLILDSARVIMISPDQIATVTPVDMQQPNQLQIYDENKVAISDFSVFEFYKRDEYKEPIGIVGVGDINFRLASFGTVPQVDGSVNVTLISYIDSTPRNQIFSFNFKDKDRVAITPLYGMYDSFQFDRPLKALSVYMENPQQMRLSSTNQLYFPIFKSAIVKVDLNSGLATLVAGSISQSGFKDNTTAIDSLLSKPNTVLELDSGIIIISDTGNNRIRKIDSNGNITTLIGTGVAGSSGDFGPAIQCQLNGPRGLALPLDSMKGQFLFDFADTENNKIRRLQNDLTIVPVLSSNDGISRPNGIIYSPNGDLYIASQGNHKVVKFSNGKVTVVAGNGKEGYTGDGGPATEATLGFPSDVAVSSTGEIFIADGENDAIRKVFVNGTITTIVLHNYVSGPDINGVALTSTGDLFYSTANRIKLLINENSGMCIDNSTCNNHGICEKRRCICDSGWRGNLNCGQFSCNVDIPPRHSSECIGPNQYACIEGWTGVNCTHKCPQGWTGTLCEIPICDGIPAGKPTVCNSNGHCISNNTCECNEGFKGQFCQDKKQNKGTDESVIIAIAISVLLSFLICILCVIALIVGLVVYYKKKGKSKTEEFDNLIPHWSMNTVQSEVSFLRNSKQEGNQSSTESANNTRNHFHIRDKEYVKSKKLGSGASGSVFLFDELTNKEQVAVKIIEVLNENGSEFKEVVNMFELSEEANPHIVPILGCTMVENGRYICILMPLYQCDLRNWVYSNKDIVSIELIVEIVKQIALALQYLHSRNMVHRDLKQTNIFVAKSKDLPTNSVDVASFQLCVGDWGSSRSQTRSNLTAYEGTIQYSSPESILKGEFSPKSDVWSLGCILYQLLSADYNSCLMRMKQTTMDDQIDAELAENVKKSFSQRDGDCSNKKLFEMIGNVMVEMLRYSPDERISTDQIVKQLSSMHN